jgi:hypothetical protein
MSFDQESVISITGHTESKRVFRGVYSSPDGEENLYLKVLSPNSRRMQPVIELLTRDIYFELLAEGRIPFLSFKQVNEINNPLSLPYWYEDASHFMVMYEIKGIPLEKALPNVDTNTLGVLVLDALTLSQTLNKLGICQIDQGVHNSALRYDKDGNLIPRIVLFDLDEFESHDSIRERRQGDRWVSCAMIDNALSMISGIVCRGKFPSVQELTQILPIDWNGEDAESYFDTILTDLGLKVQLPKGRFSYVNFLRQNNIIGPDVPDEIVKLIINMTIKIDELEDIGLEDFVVEFNETLDKVGW